MSDNDKSWFDALSDILSKPLPGTEKSAAPADKPVVFTDDDDDDSLLDRITEIDHCPERSSSSPQSVEPHRQLCMEEQMFA